MKREGFASRIGFIMVSAGCAIGIGNVWKFPWMAGKYGGGIFVLFYLLFLLVMGVPVLTCELAVGRASRKSAVGGYLALQRPRHKWHWHGWVCIAGCALLMMYYTTVSGWMLNYMVKFATGGFVGVTTSEAVGGVFTSMLASPTEMTGYMALTVVVGFLVCLAGVQKGLERITKAMMILLIALIFVLAVHSMTLPGGGQGLRYYLLPDLAQVSAAGGLGAVAAAAMNQAFFTLSLGIGAMEVLGSYMSDRYALTGEALRIAGLDTLVALLAGLIIFPACSAFGVAPDQGPSLIFMTLPNVFVQMAGGRLWGTLFFLFMTFAAFSTVIAVFENLIAAAIDSLGMTRQRATLLCLGIVLIGSIPCALGYNVLSGVHPLPGKDILDTEDFIVSNLLLPLGSLVFLAFCSLRFGWGFQNYLAQANSGEGVKMPAWVEPYFKFVLPVLVLIILVQGLLPA